MKFTISHILIFVTIVALAVAGGAYRHRENGYQVTIASLTQQRDELVRIKQEGEKAVSDSMLFAAMLSEIGDKKETYSDLFALLHSIPPESLQCTVETFSELPSVRLAYIVDRSTTVSGFGTPKSAHLLIKNDSIEVIDYVIVDGTGATRISTCPSTMDDCDFAGQKYTAKYVITPTGFVRED